LAKTKFVSNAERSDRHYGTLCTLADDCYCKTAGVDARRRHRRRRHSPLSLQSRIFFFSKELQYGVKTRGDEKTEKIDQYYNFF